MAGRLRDGPAKQWAVAWGWESTIDHRYYLTADEWTRSASTQARSDSETTIEPSEMDALRESLEKSLGRKSIDTPGGSPLISVLSLNEFRGLHPHLSIPRPLFWGLFSPSINPLVADQSASKLLEFATAHTGIKGTICIENPAASVKTMYSVFTGRRMDGWAFHQLQSSIARMTTELAGTRIVLGVGGLNKSKPEYLASLVSQFRGSVRNPCVVFVATNSFAPIMASPGSDALMRRYVELLRSADVVSFSSDEVMQVASWLGVDGAAMGVHPVLERLDLPGLAVCHGRSGCVFRCGAKAVEMFDTSMLRDALSLIVSIMNGYYRTGVANLDTLEAESDRDQPVSDSEFQALFGISPYHASAIKAPCDTRTGKAAITGLGARFDGLLSAMLPYALR
jgi:hypothetical protein